jgi:hypothetical protein
MNKYTITLIELSKKFKIYVNYVPKKKNETLEKFP